MVGGPKWYYVTMKVRTRFAPSPTGFLHVGGVRTALFAWLLARQNHGQFILRLEDTDKAREVEGSGQHIIESLSWLGIDWDEGPFKQSDRLDSYQQWAKKLIKQGRAYADPYSAEEVQTFRQQAQKDKQPFLYRNHRPESPPEWDGSQPLRFKSDPKDYEWHDEVMGDLKTGPEVVDDIILIKSDGYPTYNFAHIVDDAEMEITHVIRGQEFMSSMPNYLNLYEALGLDRPVFATVPHILAPEGHKKLGKRDGAKDILDYAKEGFLPAAMMSFLATLGWNDGTEQEVFTQEELVKKFSLGRVQRSSARFDERHLHWVNGYIIRELPLDLLSQAVENFWPPEAANFDKHYRQQVLATVQERIKYFAELPDLTWFFFTDDLPVNDELIQTHKQLKKLDSDELKGLLQRAQDALRDAEFETDQLQAALNKLLEDTNQKPAVLFSLIRIAITQAPSSPGLAASLAVLGKDRSLKRIQTAYDTL